MPFCQKCGNKLEYGAAFCSKCGTATEWAGTANKPEEYAKREQVFIGKVRKCPNCGAVLNTDSVVCPECGMELGISQIGNAISEFKNKINIFENKRKIERRNRFLNGSESSFMSDLNRSILKDKMESVSFQSEEEKNKFIDDFIIDAIKTKNGDNTNDVGIIAYTPLESEKEFAQTLSNIPIPHNKGEILEFLSLAKSSLAGKTIESYWYKHWYAFLIRCVSDGKLFFGDDENYCNRLDAFVSDVLPPKKTFTEQLNEKTALINAKKMNKLKESSNGGSDTAKKALKWTGIGCGGFFLFCLLISIISAALGIK